MSLQYFIGLHVVYAKLLKNIRTVDISAFVQSLSNLLSKTWRFIKTILIYWSHCFNADNLRAERNILEDINITIHKYFDKINEPGLKPNSDDLMLTRAQIEEKFERSTRTVQRIVAYLAQKGIREKLGKFKESDVIQAMLELEEHHKSKSKRYAKTKKDGQK